jgi:selenide, water dikinase
MPFKEIFIGCRIWRERGGSANSLVVIFPPLSFFSPRQKGMESSCALGCETTGRKRARFEPSSVGLPEDFVLTDYTKLKGCSCKLPQPKLLALLKAISSDPGKTQDVGMDCSIVEVRRGAQTTSQQEILSLVSTTDFFFPSVEDPFLQGQIGCANVLSDLYSMGIVDCDNILMLLAASTDMDDDERYHCTLQMMKGFAERATLAETRVTGGQTVMNPWPLIGGVAMRVVAESEMVRPTRIVAGDVLVLTKPIGVQLAVNLKQWTKRPSLIYKNCVEGHMSEDEIEELYSRGADNMKRLNRNGARLMIKHSAHAATDVTGFGILGHARNLGAAQDANVFLELSLMPVIRGAIKASRLMDDKYKLFLGLSAETSGGLLVALPNIAVAEKFIAELKQLDGVDDGWIVGKVRDRTTSDAEFAEIRPDAQFIDV